MTKLISMSLCPILFVLTLVSHVHGADETFMEQFIGSPLLILAGIFIITAIAFVYRKIRK